jgi:LacI family transcriptional regulator
MVENPLLPGRKPTINDVADAAGVSRATASRALSDYGRVSKSTVDHVRAIANQIGYRSNDIARSMRAGKSNTIGLVVIADFTNVFFDRATKGIVDTARSHGFEVLISNTDENLSVEREAVATLLQKQVDGLIVVAATASVHDHLDPKSIQFKPLVLIDRTVPGVNATTITTDDFTSCEESVRSAFKLGHRRMAFLVATPNVTTVQSVKPLLQNSAIEDRVNGFQSALADSNIKNAQWAFSPDVPELADSAIENFLDSKNAPTIIFTSNNDMALAALRVFGKRGLKIGSDISLVTVDDSQWLEAISPGITVVERPVDELARLAVEKLIEQISQPGTKPEKIVLPTRLISRGSIANLKANK